MLKTLLVDDDKNSLAITKRALDLFDDVETVALFTSAMDAIDYIKNNEVDLVLLDIEMSDMSGFELASYLHRNHPTIQYVFVTGHSDFAVDGYQYQPLSFLVKPISISRLEQIIDLAKDNIQDKAEKKITSKQVGIHVDSNLEIVNVSDVIYFETVGRKVKVVCKNNRSFECSETLKKLYQVFEEYGFYRSHQSFVVQIALIESISSDMFRRSYNIKLRNVDKLIPLSRDNYNELNDILKQRGIVVL